MAHINFKDSEREIAQFTGMVHRRMVAAGARGVGKDDIYNELVVAWCKARDAFDPTKGASFKTFLHRGMQLHINPWAQKQIDQAVASPVSINQNYAADCDDDLEAALPDTRVIDADRMMIGVEAVARFRQALSPKARMIADILENPPEEITRELDAVRARAELARGMGFRFVAPTGVTTAMLFNLFGIERAEGQRIHEEFKSARALAAA